MGSGTKDYWITAETDIVAQTIAKMEVDVIAQTLDKLSVDISAQSLSNLVVDIAAQTLDKMSVDLAAQSLSSLAVDIAAQTLTNLSVDISAQSLGDLAVDIATQTLDKLNVDLAAQSLSKLDIDVTAQSLDNLVIDIGKQSLGEIIQRPKYGAPSQSQFDSLVVAGDTYNVHEFTGKGKMYGFFCRMYGAENMYKCELTIKADGNVLASFWPSELFDAGIFDADDYVVHLTKYDQENNNYCIASSLDITFESSLDIVFDGSNLNNTGIIESFASVALI